MDNISLIHSYVESALSGKSTFIANAELRIEPIGDTLQLWAKQEGMVSSSRPAQKVASVILKDKTSYWSALHSVLLEHSFLPIYPAPSKGFYQYEFATVPPNYTVNYSDGLLLLQAWWQYQQQEDKSGLLGMLVWHGRTWHPIRSIDCHQGVLKILSWGNEISVLPSERVVWLLKTEPEEVKVDESTAPVGGPTSSEDQAPAVAPPSLQSSSKCIGNYLLEAGLLSAAQVDVILSDQSSTGMRFGEIAVSRGWLKEQTIEYLMKHLISPRQKAFSMLGETARLPAETLERSAKAAEKPSAKTVEKQPTEAADRRLADTADRSIDPLSKSIHDRETLVIRLQDVEELI